MKWFILGLFIATYILIIALPKYKAFTVMASAIAAVIGCAVSGFLTVKDALLAIDYNVVMMLLGIMLTVAVFSESKMPGVVADKMIAKIPNSLVAITLLAVLSGVISAFIDNVATVLMLAPIGLAVSKKLNVSPIPVIISIAVSSNLQGAATLVGDTTSIMLAGAVDMSFFDFFFMDGKPSIFWAVELGMLATIPVILIIFRKENKKLLYEKENVKATSIVPTILLLTNIALLIVTSFIPNKFAYTNGIICMAFGIASLIFHTVKFKENAFKFFKDNIDYQTVIFLTFLFIIISAVDSVGIIKDISNFFANIGSNNVFVLYTVIVFGSMIISAFIDNIPYVATMLPVISALTLPGVDPRVMYFGLLIGATLGGNLTPVGASANVVGTGILTKEGYKVKFTDFMKIGVPFTLIAVTVGWGFTWLIWGL